MIRKAEMKDVPVIAELALQLWPHHVIADLKAEFTEILEKKRAAFFLAYHGETACGFAQCQLRLDYVEGTETSPVGYLEGIYVAQPYRKKGIAKALVSACENWAREQGCSEFASDCELDNAQSLCFHLNVGFEEANRIICFTKRL